MENKKLNKAGYLFLALFTFIFCIILLELVSYGVDAFMKGALNLSPADTNFYSNWQELIVYIIDILVLGGIFFFFFREEEAGIKPIMGDTIIKALVFALAFSGITLVWFWIVEKIPSLNDSIKDFDQTTSTMVQGSPLLVFIVTAILGPIEEEIIFRGIIFNALAKVRKGLFPIIISALLFGFIHVIFVQVVYTFFMGLITALVYEKSKNLTYPILIHGFANGLSVISGYMNENTVVLLDGLALVMIIPMVVILVREFNKYRQESTI